MAMPARSLADSYARWPNFGPSFGQGLKRLALLLCPLALLPACTASGQERFALPPISQDEVTFAQGTDNRPLDLSESGGKVGWTWSGWGEDRRYGSFYYPMDRDLDKSHNMDWYRANHPDWVVYKCDRITPAPLYTYYWGFATPIDVTNPQVRDYVMNTHIAPGIQSGKRIVAIDNVSLSNDSNRCGVLRNGQWVQLYSGEKQDPAYARKVIEWVGWLADQVHANGGIIALNAKIKPYDIAATREVIALGDIWWNEAAFTRGCQRVSDEVWRTRFDLVRWAAARMPWVDQEKTCVSPADVPPDEAAWMLGNFLLMRGPQSYFSALHEGDAKGPLRYPATFNPPVGRATGEAEPVEGGGWKRTYSRGLVVVNPSSTSSLAFLLPDGEWNDIAGNPVQGTLAIGPSSAAVLTRRGADQRR
jgi:hypothetical protein